MRSFTKWVAVVMLVGLMAVPMQAEIVLRMAGWGGAPDTEGFEALHPGVKIEYHRVPGSYAYIEQTAVWAAGGVLPDILLIPYWGIPSMAENGVLRDISDLAAADEEWMSTFFPGSMEAFTRNGGVYGVPWLVGPMSVVYNRDMFAAFGLTDPMDAAWADAWDMDALIENARRLTRHTAEGGLEQIGLYSDTNQLHFVAPLVWALGGDLFADDGMTPLVNSMESTRAIDRLAELYSQDRIFVSRQQLGAYNWDVNRASYGASTAMRLVWNVEYSGWRANGVDVNIAPVPRSTTGAPTDLVIAHGIGISSQTEHADLAWEYIKYALTQTPENLEFPARQEHFVDWADFHLENNGWDAYPYLSLVTNSIRLAPNPLNRDIELIYTRQLNRALLGQIPAQSAVEEIARQVEAQKAKLDY